MKLSTRTRYGVRLMLELALHDEEGPLQLGAIAKREEISEKYLSQIIIPLRLAGLVNSVRGTQGGYMLSKPPARITALDIAEALEGELEPVPCVMGEENCSRIGECAARNIWCDLDKAVKNVLQSYSLETLVDIYNKTSRVPIDYVI